MSEQKTGHWRVEVLVPTYGAQKKGRWMAGKVMTYTAAKEFATSQEKMGWKVRLVEAERPARKKKSDDAQVVSERIVAKPARRSVP